MAIAGLPLAAGIAGGASLVGGLISDVAGGNSISAQEAFQQQELNQTENYNTNMSNTAYQRAMTGMESAGINPILAAGSPASSPTASAPGGASMQIPNVLSGAASSAMDAMSTQADLVNKGLQGAQTSANTLKTQADTKAVQQNMNIKGPEALAAKTITDNVNGGLKALDGLTNSAENAISNYSQSHPDVSPKVPGTPSAAPSGSNEGLQDLGWGNNLSNVPGWQ